MVLKNITMIVVNIQNWFLVFLYKVGYQSFIDLETKGFKKDANWLNVYGSIWGMKLAENGSFEISGHS